MSEMSAVSASTQEIVDSETMSIPVWRDLLVLLKPNITLMTIIVAAGSMALAPTAWNTVNAIGSLLGIALIVAGAGAFNMYLERDIDALMPRTRTRPLPTKRLASGYAVLVGFICTCLSAPLLWAFSNPLTTGLAFFSLFVYVLVYTPMKQRSWWSLIVGAVPGAMPSMMGYVAASNQIDLVCLSLFGIAFLWQLPHFVAISIYRMREYTAAGHKVLPALYGIDIAKTFIIGTTAPLIALGVVLWPLGLATPVYAMVALLLGVWFLLLTVRGFSAENANSWARRVFIGSLVYQTVLYAALAIDVVIQKVLIS